MPSKLNAFQLPSISPNPILAETPARRLYAYDAQGNVVDVTDSNGNVVASYSYDAFGALTSSSENFPNGWSNPFRYDGVQGVRYDTETGLYWMSVRAYDPTLGRFISHDPLGRLAAMGLAMQPYVYAGNNPVNNTDPSGMLILGPNGERAVRTSKGTEILSDKCWECLLSPSTRKIKVDCRQGRNYVTVPECARFNQWKDSAENIRINQLTPAFRVAGAIGIAGTLLAVTADGIDLYRAARKGDKREVLEDGIDLALSVLSGLTYFGDLFYNTPQANTVNHWIGRITSLVNAFLGGFRFAMAVVDSMPDWIAGGMLVTIAVSSGGIEGSIGALLLSLLAGQALQKLAGAGHVLMAEASKEATAAQDQLAVPIWDWCQQNNCSGATGDPNPYVYVNV